MRIRYDTRNAGSDLAAAIKSDPALRKAGSDSGMQFSGAFRASAKDDLKKFFEDFGKGGGKVPPIRPPVEPDTTDLPKKMPKTGPPVKVPLDPLAAVFKADVQRLASTLAKEVHAKLPVDPETAELRAKLAAEIAELHRSVSVDVPVEPGDRAEFEAKVKALADLVSHRVKANLPVEVDEKKTKDKVDKAAKDVEKTTKGISLPVNINIGGLLASFARISSTTLIRSGTYAGVAALGTALGSVASEGVALAGAIAPAAGAIALLPAAAFAAAAGLGTLALAGSGLVEAFKQSVTAATSGGQSMAAAERQIAAAQRESLAAQRDLNRARQEAARNLRDLTVQLAGARLDEREAVQNVADAQKALNAAIAGQNPATIERAQLAYDQAQQSLTEVQNRVTDLTASQADAQKKGIEGSDQVQAALDRQRSAADALASAQENLAHQGAGVRNAMAKLAPAAQELVRTLLSLRGGFDDVRRAVQQATFAGVAADVRSLAGTYLPLLKDRLGEIGGAFNQAIRQAAGFLGSKQTVADISTALHNTAVSASNLSRAVAPILGALRDIGVVGSGFLPQLAAGFTKVAEQFGAFISNARQTGQLQAFIQTALDTLTQLGGILRNVGSILFSVLNAGKDVGGGLLNTLQQVTGTLAAFFKTAEGKTTLQNFFATTKAVVDALLPPLLTVAKALGTTILPAVANAIVAMGPALQIFASGLAAALGALAPAFGPISQIISGLISSLGPGLLALAQGLAAAFAALAPAAIPVGRAISDLVVALAPLLPLIGTVLAVGLTQAATVLSLLSRELGPFIGLISKALTGAMQALLPVLLKIGETALPLIADAMSKAAAAFGPIIPVIAQMAQQFATALIPFITQFEQIMAGQLLPALLQLLPVLANGLLQALQQIAPHIPAIATAFGEMAVSAARILVALTPLIPPFVKLATLFVDMITQSGFITAAYTGLANVLQLVAGVLVTVSGGFAILVRDVVATGGAIRDRFESLVSFVTGLPGRIGRAASGMWDGIWQAFRSAINSIVGAWNRLHFSIPSITIPFIGEVFAGTNFYVPQIPYAAEGALVPATRGGRPVMLGDGGEDEWALGNTKLAALLAQAASAGAAAALAGSGGTGTRIEVPVYLNRRQIALAVREGETELKRG